MKALEKVANILFAVGVGLILASLLAAYFDVLVK